MTQERDRRLHTVTVGLLLVGMLAGITYCPGSSAMACRMDEPVAAGPSDCGSCVAPGKGAPPTSVQAGSCCRFTTPEEGTTLPAWKQPSKRTVTGVELLALPPTLASRPAFEANAAGDALATGVSEPPAPQSLSTHLRL
jgi:hypothetical protein